MAKKKIVTPEEVIEEKISVEPMEEVMGDRYATYAKYVIQDRAIPDVRDGLKPVQRRIIFSMYKSNNVFNKPTRKCAHTVGAVMGTYHPHGDTSIYEALARMSQDWKVRYPLIDFQGNNGSIDGDSPAAYRYTESRLSELSNELIKDIEKKTVDMQLNFDDTEFEPIVLPSRFPNLFVNGTEGIAVALATEIPPHNLREVIEATIYRISHKTSTIEDLMQIVKGPDFPGGGYIYNSDGLKNIYLTGRGRIELSSKCEIISNKDNQQIVITEIPYKIVKIQLVYEIDKIIHSKAVDGMLEVRDESDWKGIRIVIDCKKDAKCDLLLKYLMNKTSLVCGYSANMVAIVNGRPKTLNLLDYIDAYIAHQVDVVTRKSQYDLNKATDRLHIVEGLILASLNINDVVEIIKKSKDKADSKVNLMARYGLSNEQAEAIVTMPLYKLSHTDELTLEREKESLLKDIEFLNGILADPNKLNRVLIKDLKEIAEKYGDDRRTQIIEKEGSTEVDKRDLIAKEEVMIALTRDGYLKRSSLKSYKGSGERALPGVKEGDVLVSSGLGITTDYLVCFTSLGNYVTVPVHKMQDTKWKDEGAHLNQFATLSPGEKIVKGIIFSEFRHDLYIAFLTKFGQIKRMCVDQLDADKHSRPVRCMKLLSGDEIVGIETLTGNSDLFILTADGHGSLFNENELNILGSKAGGVKSINGLNSTSAACLMAFDEEEYSKIVIFTDKSSYRIIDTNRLTKTQRLGKTMEIVPSFKNDKHTVVAACKIDTRSDINYFSLYLSNQEIFEFSVDNYYLTDATKNAKKNIETPAKTLVVNAYTIGLEKIDNKSISHPIVVKEKPAEEVGESDSSEVEETNVDNEPRVEEEPAKEKKFEQISMFDDLDD
ncbi:MAG: DNA topoisomerase IV subunit A [Bacilli bacterium]|nr:DNA topoisomerase IV subunit A [Bacilli bacterium]